jgi:hypothetical protein
MENYWDLVRRTDVDIIQPERVLRINSNRMVDMR